MRETSEDWYHEYEINQHRQRLLSQLSENVQQQPPNTISDPPESELKSKEEPDAAPYRLTFGKHKGKTLDEFAQSGGQGYIHWMVKESIPSKWPDLQKALDIYHSLRHSGSEPGKDKKEARAGPLEVTTPTTPIHPPPLRPKSDHSPPPTETSWDYVVKFGKHKGQKLSEIPDSYLRWLRTQDLRIPELTAILRQISDTDKPLPEYLRNCTSPPPHLPSSMSSAPGYPNGTSLGISNWIKHEC